MYQPASSKHQGSERNFPKPFRESKVRHTYVRLVSHAERRKIITAEKYLLSSADNKRHNRPQGLFAGMSVLRAILLTAHVASGLSSGSRAAPAPAARPALGGGGSGGDGGDSSDDEALVQSLTAQALGERGTPEGLSALETLDWLSSRRLPYDFGVSEDGGGAGPGPGRFPRRGVVSRLRRVLPGDVAAGASDLVDDMERRGWLSTNPDSVDGLPSLHLNLVSGGRRSSTPPAKVRTGGAATPPSRAGPGRSTTSSGPTWRKTSCRGSGRSWDRRPSSYPTCS